MLTAEKLVRNFNRIRDRATGPAGSGQEPPRRLPTTEPGVPPGYISERAFAQRCGVSLRTVRRWRDHRQDPPTTRFGRKVCYRIEAMEQWEREREQKRGRK